MNEDEENLANLTHAAGIAWTALDAAHRDIPDCEHNRAWKAGIAAALETHRKAISARDRQLRKMDKPED